ncbi:MAG: hypothetical protein R2817_11505 [Flavobacteriales bacterium]
MEGRLTSASVLFVVLSMAALVVRYPPSNVFSWDVFGYYLYLPASLIHHDPAIHDIGWVEKARLLYDASSTLYQAQEQPDGGWVLKYPVGLALLWSPFFLLGHAAAWMTGQPMDGFSAPYQWSIISASLAFVAIGMHMLGRFLLRYFPDKVSALGILLIGFGTNYLHQAVWSVGMPHVPLFALQATLLLLTVRWYGHGRTRDALLIACTYGLLCLVRPSEAVFILIPLLYGVVDARSLKARFVHWRERRAQLLLMFIVLAALASVQFVYWKALTGKFLYMSYNNPGEGFEFHRPFLVELLFSFRKGWLVYTPLMAFAVAGIWSLHRERSPWWLAMGAFFLVNLYIVSSWSCWWYADSFGQRSLVQSYAVMAMPLLFLIRAGWNARPTGRVFTLAVVPVLVLLNLFQTYQATRGIIHTSRMTKAAYQATFGKVDPPAGLGDLFLPERLPTLSLRRPVLTGHRPVALAEVIGSVELAWPVEEVAGKGPFYLMMSGGAPARTAVELRHAGYPYGATSLVLSSGDGSCWYTSPDVRRPSDTLALSITDVPSDHHTSIVLWLPMNAD